MLDPLFLAFNDPYVLKAIISACLGATIGMERELAGKDPGLRTFSFICLGSCLFTEASLLGAKYSEGSDPMRISAQIVTGIGFLGAGAIFRSPRGGVSGLTTAALMWVTASLGILVGIGAVQLATVGTALTVFTSLFLKVIHVIFYKLGLDKKNYDKPGP